MNGLTDQQLLRDYAAKRSEAAFAELVRRHVDLVYSAALRMVRDAHLAQDVTQGVFVALSQSAKQLGDRPVLSGWLHRTAQNIAANAVRSDVRRRAREQEAAVMNEILANDSNAAWEQIAPHLDAAVGALSEPDRDALMLRFFERKSAHEMAQTLGVSDEAAQKRVTRAVERLREFFAKRGVTVAAGGLAVVITANAVQAAPAGLATAIVTATLAGTATASTVIATTTKTIAMTTLQKTLVAGTIVVIAGVGIYEAAQANRLRNEIQSLQTQQQAASPLADDLQRLQRERDDATNRLALLSASVDQLNGNSAELLKLRAEVTRLRKAGMTLQDSANSPELAKAKSMVDRVKAIKQGLEQAPERKIPELQFLDEQEWFNALSNVEPLETESDFRLQYAHLRDAAKDKFAHIAMFALARYVAANDNQLPSDPTQLKAFFDPPLDNADAILSRYKMFYSGNLDNLPKPGIPVMGEKVPADEKVDSYYSIGVGNFSKTSVIGFSLPHP